MDALSLDLEHSIARLLSRDLLRLSATRVCANTDRSTRGPVATFTACLDH